MSKKGFVILSLLCVVSLLTACNLPGQAKPTQDLFPTPNLTLTALFAPGGIPPTVTPPALVTATSGSVVVATTTPPAATATQAASATPTKVPPSATAVTRPGPAIKAAYLATAPKIDGDWGEWKTDAYPARFVVFGAGNWKNSDDLEGSFRVGWDNTYLYVAVKVLDDTYVQNATGAEIYKGDSIELLFDSDLWGDFAVRSLSNDDYQIGISAGKDKIGGATSAYLWYPSGKAGNLSDVKIAAVSSTGVYRVEFAIPWKTLGVTPASGGQFGFGLSISDDDKAGSKEQQSMVSNLEDRNFLDPGTWGTLTLTK
ncbi:hypothetical protein LARV_01824 [Longilinea arvoryzae]|uniref:Carbohydrate-binding domain-containing protein n=1 Tax=Longilinea arvoryzae TaxID=360412 RepID=A0A0S7B9R2_9CHLR|nr:sugar-binding protein [Longilinea arvoryzae]GAP14062.1 hypothetical protein LARV_01824 [Longilinea arvoryzae]